MGMFNKVNDLFKVKSRTTLKEKFYNQLEKINDRASKKDDAYLLEARIFIENIIKETFDLKDEYSELNILLDENINDYELKTRLHNIRIRANNMAHEINYESDKKLIKGDLKTIDDLIDYCCFKNEKINDFELFSLVKRLDEEKKIDEDVIYNSKTDSIVFEEIPDMFQQDVAGKTEYYTSSYNAKSFCLAIDELYKDFSKECNPIFFVVHNILIRKDMVRKSPYLNKLNLTAAELDIVRFYEILILHSMKYAYFRINKENTFETLKDDVKYLKIAYENIMYYANVLNKMKKNPTNLDYQINIIENNEKRFIINNKTFNYYMLKEIPENAKVNMWFSEKIDYEITEENKYYYNIILKDLFGFDSFREGQLDVIKNILENNIKNIPLSVFPTGYGKSLIYQFCAILEPQITIVIVPTEVLACDQIFNLNECGLNIGQIISCYQKNLNNRNGNLIYYTIPDVFLNNELNDKLSHEDKKDNIYNIVLDECHNISLWGHQFDPTYFSLSKNIIYNFKNCNVTMFTATASKLVIDDITNQFSDMDIDVYQPVGLKRGHINYHIKKIDNINEIIKDISNLYNKNYEKKNEWDLSDSNKVPSKTLIINNDPKILNEIYNGLQENDNILPYISVFDNSVNTYKSYRTGRKKILITNDDFVVGINIPDLVNLICIGVPPSKEWLYQESGRVGRNFENSNVIIYVPKKTSNLFNKIIDTKIDIKNILVNKELQNELNIDVSNINYFNSYFQNKNKQLEAFDYVKKGIENNIYVSGNSKIGELNISFPFIEKELYNYLLYMMVLFDYIKIWQTRSSNSIDTIKYRLFARAEIDLNDMKEYLNQTILISTKNKTIRNKYIRANNEVTDLKDLLSNLLDWYYETIITIKREMLVNTYELLLTDKINSKEIEQNLAIYFDISSNMRENNENINFNNYNENEILDELEVEGVIDTSEQLKDKLEVIDNKALNINDYENIYFQEKVELKEEKLSIQKELQKKEKIITKPIKKQEKSKIKTSKKDLTPMEKIMHILSNIYDDKNVDFLFFELYNSLSKEDKYNFQFMLQREIEAGYIYGYEMMMSIIELETKGSNLVRFSKFAKITNKQLLELLIEKDIKKIPHSNKKKAYKIIYSLYEPNSIWEKLKTWI